jgi:peptide chain release factor 3
MTTQHGGLDEPVVTDAAPAGESEAGDRRIAAAASASDGASLRRTFAIISHPDAGKTTLTEKLLLFGGAISQAGHVKSRGERRRTQSDWLEIERKRGISVSSSVMTFERDGVIFNLLDTPGHEDFSEDTYRTLTAVDSAVVVIDAAKGIESQTRKLFEVCRLRDIPIMTFINKVDREGRDPFELLDEIESTLALDVVPLTWPVGAGGEFHGCFDLRKNLFLTSKGGPARNFDSAIPFSGPGDPELEARITKDIYDTFKEGAELAHSAYPDFDVSAYRAGHMTPVFFGSALKDYSVGELLTALAEYAPSPRPQPTASRTVEPGEEQVSGYVFKVQANLDPNHRDRVAFVRLCSGRFRRGMKLRHSRSGKMTAITNPIFFFAQEREILEEAFAGDVIGIPNHGTLRVGDALTEGEQLSFTGIPSFAPEVLRRVRLHDPMRSKQLRAALLDLAEEGVAQAFRPLIGAQWIVGVVGHLQLDVLASRLAAEYKVDASFETSPYEAARWVASDDPAILNAFMERNRASMAEDRDGAPVYMASTRWQLDYTMKNSEGVKFLATREFA